MSKNVLDQSQIQSHVTKCDDKVVIMMMMMMIIMVMNAAVITNVKV